MSPSLPRKRCIESGCTNTTSGNRCTEHGGTRSGSPAQRGYGAAWTKRANDFKRRHPFCWCGQPTHTANHKTPRRVLVAQGVADPDADQYLEPLCRHHNAVVTGAGQ